MDPVENVYAAGTIVSLRPPAEADIDAGWTAWFNDETVVRHLVSQYWPNSRESQRRYFDSLHAQRDRLVLSIVDSTDGKLVGTGSLSSINFVHRYAYIAVVIGAREFHKGPVAMEAYNLFLRVAFRRLNLRTVISVSSSGNKSVHAVHRAVGFVEYGRIPAVYETGGELFDSVFSAVDATSWLERQ